MSDIKISVLDSLDQMKDLKPSWNQLLKKSTSNSIFLSWEWQYSWAETFLDEARRLFLVTVYFKNDMVGIAPWYINLSKVNGLTIRQLSFLGNPEAASDYLDVIIKKGKEKKVTNQIYSYLFSEGKKQWDSLTLRDIPSDSLFLLYLHELVAEDGKYTKLSYNSFCPATNLPTTKENFLLALTPNRRQQYKRHSRLLQKDKDIRLYSQMAPTSSDLDSFFSFYENKTGYNSRHVKPMIQNLIQKDKGQGIVQIDTLLDGNFKIASLLHLKHEHTISMYLMVIDKTYNPKISIGNILVGMCMEKAIEENFQSYDFLKGTESYKFHWANSSTTSLSLTLQQRTPANLVLFLKKSLINLIKLLLR